MHPPPRTGVLAMRYVLAAAIVAALAAGAAFSLPREAEAEYEIGFVRYRVPPSTIDAWTTTVAGAKDAAKAMRWQNIPSCEAAQFDSTGDGNLDFTPGVGVCEGDGGRHIRYAGGGRDNHPGARGFTHSSGHSSAASGGNPRFTDAGILGCIHARTDGGSGCTFDALVTYHTNNNLGGY